MSLLSTSGDKTDFLSRIKALVPKKWFGAGSTPVLDAVLSAPAAIFAANYTLLTYVVQQTRIRTATGPFLDLISQDYFNGSLPRFANESDANFRARILANLFIGGPTRGDLTAVLTEITGRAPTIVEPQRIQDCGAWDYAFGFDYAGGWGDMLPYQAFVTAYRPLNSGIPYVDGWGGSVGAWDTASQIEWTDASQVGDVVDDTVIYDAIAANKPAGTRLWSRILSNPITTPATANSDV